MRPLEILFFIALSLSLLRWAFPYLQKFLPTTPFNILALLLLAVQLVFEGYRWQMLPGYALMVFGIPIPWLITLVRQPVRIPTWLKNLGSLFIGILYLASISLPVLLPVPRLSAPSGPYAVGTRTWHWTDETRIDPYAPRPGVAREIMVQAWYPIHPEDQVGTSPWMASAEIVAPAVAKWIELPSFFLDHLVHVRTPATQDAPIASSASGFPVLLFSHGYGGFRAQNTNQALQLASQGFVVLAVEHTYGSVISVFPDGRVASHNPETLPNGLPPEEDLQTTRALGDQWASDLSFVLDQLMLDNFSGEDAQWRQGLDLDRVGAFGHSTGGGAVIEFCYRDPRCKAALTLDPFIKPVSQAAITGGLSQPALHLFSETWSSSENLDSFRPLSQASDPETLVLSVLGSAHYDFSDLPLLSPLAHSLGLKGPINGKRMAAIVNAYELAYFEQALGGAPSDLLRGVSQEFPEVIDQAPIGHP